MRRSVKGRGCRRSQGVKCSLGKDARALARELLVMSQAEFSAAFKNSPMKRAKLRGLKRNSAVVLGNVGTMEDVSALPQALDDPEPFVREHADCQ